MILWLKYGLVGDLFNIINITKRKNKEYNRISIMNSSSTHTSNNSDQMMRRTLCMLSLLVSSSLSIQNGRYNLIPGCMQYNESSPSEECVRCQSGYYLQPLNETNSTDSNKCVACMPGCLDCTSNVSCIECDVGYTQMDVCVVCDERCKTCSDAPDVCTSCFLPYTTDGGACSLKYVGIAGVSCSLVILVTCVCLGVKRMKNRSARKSGSTGNDNEGKGSKDVDFSPGFEEKEGKAKSTEQRTPLLKKQGVKKGQLGQKMLDDEMNGREQLSDDLFSNGNEYIFKQDMRSIGNIPNCNIEISSIDPIPEIAHSQQIEEDILMLSTD